MNEDGRWQTYRHRRQGRTLGSMTYQGYRQEAKMDGRTGSWRGMDKRTFVGKIALLTDKLLPFKIFEMKRK